MAQRVDWTVQAINRRRSELLDWARERWAVDLQDATVSGEFDDSEEEAIDENLNDVLIDEDEV